jgi:uracil-DNA glycosylase|tara:strand:- start:363 stop:1025 length:663 start_codon:yes stop_codon:yes gene_type:complete
MSVQLPKDWLTLLEDQFKEKYMVNLKSYLTKEMTTNTIFPEGNKIFNAFNNTTLNNIKVIILGQDPYHGIGQAMGLSFSVPKGVKVPPSLQNVYKELSQDVGLPVPTHGDLTKWAKQGVLLLNSILTVRKNEPASHRVKGWEQFTDTVIHRLSKDKENLVFLLWGSFAQSKEELINLDKHLVLRTSHPSPFSADRGFFGCKHFSKTNQYLRSHNKAEIEW